MIHLQIIDYLILGVYFAFVIGIGWVLRRTIKTGEDFFQSGRRIPARIAPTIPTRAQLNRGKKSGRTGTGGFRAIPSACAKNSAGAGSPRTSRRAMCFVLAWALFTRVWTIIPTTSGFQATPATSSPANRAMSVGLEQTPSATASPVKKARFVRATSGHDCMEK